MGAVVSLAPCPAPLPSPPLQVGGRGGGQVCDVLRPLPCPPPPLPCPPPPDTDNPPDVCNNVPHALKMWQYNPLSLASQQKQQHLLKVDPQTALPHPQQGSPTPQANHSPILIQLRACFMHALIPHMLLVWYWRQYVVLQPDPQAVHCSACPWVWAVRCSKQ
jgi:hypothetical protein